MRDAFEFLRFKDLKCAPRSLCASSAEELFIISRLSRSAERSKRYFHRRGRNGKRHLQRRFLRKRGAAVGVLALTVTFGDNSPKGRALGMTGKFPGVPAPPGGAVAQRLRGYKSAEPEKTVKRSSRRTGVNLQFFSVQPTSLGSSRACSPWRRVAAPSIRFVPWAALASCWPLPQQLLPVSAAGGGRSCCVAGWVESRGREGGIGTPLPTSGPAERLCTLKTSRKSPHGAQCTFLVLFWCQKRTSLG